MTEDEAMCCRLASSNPPHVVSTFSRRWGRKHPIASCHPGDGVPVPIRTHIQVRGGPLFASGLLRVEETRTVELLIRCGMPCIVQYIATCELLAHTRSPFKRHAQCSRTLPMPAQEAHLTTSGTPICPPASYFQPPFSPPC